MQDIHARGGGAGGVGGRFFVGGERRLRPHNHPNHQALKCPRCDSLNTKFCYYNNYNLSQPRHFCKSCRRYWTKGGVLRNVPVGGGCRKTKRSKPKSSAASAGDAPRERQSDAQSSSSDSSSLTGATTAAAPTTASTAVTEEGLAVAPSNTTPNSAVVHNFPGARLFSSNLNFDHQPLGNQSTDGQIFAAEIGSFTGMMTSSEDMMSFGMTNIPTTSYGRVQPGNQAEAADNPDSGMVATTAVQDEFRMQEMTGGMSNHGLAAALDWSTGAGGGSGDQGLFDLTAAVDPAYWSQSQWADNDQSLNYLP